MSKPQTDTRDESMKRLHLVQRAAEALGETMEEVCETEAVLLDAGISLLDTSEVERLRKAEAFADLTIPWLDAPLATDEQNREFVGLEKRWEAALSAYRAAKEGK